MGTCLRTDTTNVWLDCGSGTFANLQRHIDLADLHGIVCSHSHPDHWLELPVAVNALRYGVGLPDAEIPRVLDRGDGPVVRCRQRPAAGADVLERGRRTSPRASRIGDIDISFSRTDHPVETLAVRADSAGKSIAYTADTGDDWSLASLGEGIDVALVEATLEHPTSGIQHLTADAGGFAGTGSRRGIVGPHASGAGIGSRGPVRRGGNRLRRPIAVAEIDERYET